VLRPADLVLAWLGIYTRVICVSRAVLASCRRYPAGLLNRTVVVYNGLREFRRSSLTREQARTKFAVPSGRMVLVAIGRFVPQKNYPLLMRVVERLDNVVLLVAGDGYLRKDIEADIAARDLGDKVRLLGNLGRNDVPDLLASADLFIQTSNYEGQSNTVLEALAAGVPMVLHDVPEQRETIEDDGTGEIAGALVPLEDVDAWVAAIEAYRRDPALAETARAVAKRRVDMFTYDKMIDGFEAAIAA
jgi:glycosyltransferase involved in cell wall biosynthesis